MNKVGMGLMVGVLFFGSACVGAHEEHEHGAAAPHLPAAPTASPLDAAQAGEQTLTGEVVDVFCYLSHPAEGLGPKHAGCAKKCIKSGLPVAIRVGDQLYLATMSDHNPANQKLADLAAEQVTVKGKVMERDGQRLIAITSVEKAQ